MMPLSSTLALKGFTQLTPALTGLTRLALFPALALTACSHTSTSTPNALTLQRQADSARVARIIAYCDSVLPLRQAHLNTLKNDFVLENDSTFGAPANYVHRQQAIERNIGRSYLRSGVAENGDAFLASVYFGSSPLHHTALRISAPNGLFAQTSSIPFDGGRNYRFFHNGAFHEIVTYRGHDCHDALQFLYENRTSRLQADFLGGHPFQLTLSLNDQDHIAHTWLFSFLLKDLTRLTRERRIAKQRLDYLQAKLQQ
jgi:hypothetical protein